MLGRRLVARPRAARFGHEPRRHTGCVTTSNVVRAHACQREIFINALPIFSTGRDERHGGERAVELESETLRRNEALRQRTQLTRDVQELRLGPAWTNELDTDGKSVLEVPNGMTKAAWPLALNGVSNLPPIVPFRCPAYCVVGLSSKDQSV